MIKIHGQLTPDDLISAQRLHAKSEGWARLLPIIVAVLGLLNFFYVVLLTLISANAPWYLFGVPLLLLVFPFTKYVVIPWQTRRAYDQSDIYSSPQEIEIDEASVKISNSAGYTERKWKDYIKWKANAQLIMLYHTDMLYAPLPAHFFDDLQQFEFVKAQLRDHQVPDAKTPRQLIVIFTFIALFFLFNLLMWFPSH